MIVWINNLYAKQSNLKLQGAEVEFVGLAPIPNLKVICLQIMWKKYPL